MNKSKRVATTFAGLTAAAALLSACATAPQKPAGADEQRSRLIQLQSNADLASRAPLAIKEAELAVSAAEKPQPDVALGQHLVFMADRKIGIAEALGQSRWAVDQRKLLIEQRANLRLQSRTQEADAAQQRATAAQADAADQRQQADSARDATADAQRNAAELQSQIDALQAKKTDRGLVLTLGDVLFAFNTSVLNTGGTAQLVKLAGFLNKYPARNAAIEGHTDSVGNENYNQVLSQRRADAVKSFLVSQGIATSRLTSAGKGESSPIGDNVSASGRQQNRRVEIIIDDNQAS
jgi:outer membrane protein OmpA-like peptidoglycan-associated protein